MDPLSLAVDLDPSGPLTWRPLEDESTFPRGPEEGPMEGGALDQPHFLGRDSITVPLGTLCCCLRERERPSLEVAVQLGGEGGEDDGILD